MKRNELYAYITASFALLVPVPGRLAYGIVLIAMLNLLMLCATLFRRLVPLLKLDGLHPVLIAVFLVAMTVLFKQWLICFSPLMALVLGFAVYMPAVSSFMIGYLYKKGPDSLVHELFRNMGQSGRFSLYALGFFLFRDVFGYGTVTLPSRDGLLTLPLVKAGETAVHVGVFWASIPGALVLSALLVVLISSVTKALELARPDGYAGQEASHAE